MNLVLGSFLECCFFCLAKTRNPLLLWGWVLGPEFLQIAKTVRQGGRLYTQIVSPGLHDLSPPTASTNSWLSIVVHTCQEQNLADLEREFAEFSSCKAVASRC